MKRISNLLATLSLCTMCVLCKAQTTIQMEKYGGVFRIPCKVNGAKMKLIFDTGADKVCLSLNMAEYLFDNDFISIDDLKGSGSSTVANGNIVDHIKINIKDIEIQGIHLRNVEAVVIDGQDAPLLLGQSALKKLGTYTINGNNLILNDYKETLSEEEVNIIEENIRNALERENYTLLIELYNRLESTVGLSANGYGGLALSYFMTKQYEKAISAGKLGIAIRNASENELKGIYDTMASSYFKLKDYESAVKYWELSEPYEKDANILASLYEKIGLCYSVLDNNYLSGKYYKKAINQHLKISNLRLADILRGNAEHSTLGNLFSGLGYLLFDSPVEEQRKEAKVYATFSAMLGDDYGKQLCEIMNINYVEYARLYLKDYINVRFVK